MNPTYIQVDKFELSVEETRKVSSLLVSLACRLCTTYNTITIIEDHSEMETLNRKQEKLMEQFSDAQALKVLFSKIKFFIRINLNQRF